MAHNNIPDSKHPMSPEEFAMWKAARRSQRQKNLALAGLSTITVAIIAMWFLQFKQNITAPLYRQLGFNNNQEIETALQNKNEASQTTQQDDALKNIDTDKDGLSDYDELNIYKTSPFIEDSDSDGVLDKVEIDRGQDPNCPIGKDCSGSILTNPAAANNSSQVDTGSITTNNPANTTGATNVGTSSDPSLPTDAASLRQVLVEAGMDKTILEQFSDSELLEAYQEAFKE